MAIQFLCAFVLTNLNRSCVVEIFVFMVSSWTFSARGVWTFSVRALVKRTGKQKCEIGMFLC